MYNQTTNLDSFILNISEICLKHEVKELSLFGSALGQNFTESSDFDFLVEFRQNVKVGFLKLARLQSELSDLLHRPVDLVPKNGLKPFIKKEVLKQAKVIYAN